MPAKPELSNLDDVKELLRRLEETSAGESPVPHRNPGGERKSLLQPLEPSPFERPSPPPARSVDVAPEMPSIVRATAEARSEGAASASSLPPPVRMTPFEPARRGGSLRWLGPLIFLGGGAGVLWMVSQDFRDRNLRAVQAVNKSAAPTRPELPRTETSPPSAQPPAARAAAPEPVREPVAAPVTIAVPPPQPTLPPPEKAAEIVKAPSPSPPPVPASPKVVSLPPPALETPVRAIPAPVPAERPAARAAQPAPAPQAPPMADNIRPDDASLARLLEQGQQQLTAGHVGAARHLFQRAAEGGLGLAALLLGDTYDPSVLYQMGARGIVGDVDKAIQWYERADELGEPQAKSRLLGIGGR